MGCKLVVFKDDEPEIGMTFTYVAPGTPGEAQGWHGECTQCGKRMHFWYEGNAFERGQQHVNRH
jgi:hypothetical protein